MQRAARTHALRLPLGTPGCAAFPTDYSAPSPLRSSSNAAAAESTAVVLRSRGRRRLARGARSAWKRAAGACCTGGDRVFNVRCHSAAWRSGSSGGDKTCPPSLAGNSRKNSFLDAGAGQNAAGAPPDLLFGPKRGGRTARPAPLKGAASSSCWSERRLATAIWTPTHPG
jgi:hypothetical protein